jgi:hypothetical protein
LTVAISFNISNLSELAALADAHPDPSRFWNWVRSHTPSADLQELCDEFLDAWADVGVTPLGEASRTADAIQELGGFEVSTMLVQRDEAPSGHIVETQVHHSAVKV